MALGVSSSELTVLFRIALNICLFSELDEDLFESLLDPVLCGFDYLVLEGFLTLDWTGSSFGYFFIAENYKCI